MAEIREFFHGVGLREVRIRKRANRKQQKYTEAILLGPNNRESVV